MKSILIRYQYYIFVLLIGVFWIEILNFLLQLDLQNRISPDSGTYYESAYNLYFFGKTHPLRPSLLALIHGIPFLFGCKGAEFYKVSFYINAFFWLATLCLVFKMVSAYLSKKNAFIITVASIFLVGNTICLFHLLSETIYLFFIVLAFYFLQKYHQKQNFLFLSIGLTIVTLSMLIKPGAMLLAIFFLIYYRKEILHNLKSKAIVFLFFSWLFVVIHCFSIKCNYGNFTISYIDSITYYNYLGSKAYFLNEGKELNQAKNPRMDYIFTLDYPEMKKVASDDFLTQLKSNKINLIHAYLSDVYDNSTAGNTSLSYIESKKKSPYFEKCKSAFFSISKWQNRLFSILGFVLAAICFLKHFMKEQFIVLLSFFVMNTILLSGISCSQGDRFHLVIYPFVLLLVAKFLKDKKRLS
jgi:hypothetical protein